VADDIARSYERRFEEPAAERLIEAVILHEMVHWADFFDDALEHGDPGLEFETAVYGQLVARLDPPDPDPAISDPNAPVFMFPVSGRIGGGTAYWGENIRQNGSRSHAGIDVFNVVGTPVHAIADGFVVGGNRFRNTPDRYRETGNYGFMIDIDHDNGYFSRYAHLDTIDVRPGPVTAGTRLGTLGASGTLMGRWIADGRAPRDAPSNYTRPHLHFEIRDSNGPVFEFEGSYDPATFFDFIPDGKDARETVVTALRRGRLLNANPAHSGWDAPNNDTDGIAPNSSPNLGVGEGAPRGIRNNNPGNLVRDDTPWDGLRPASEQMDTKFHQFIEMKWGIRAMAKNLISYKKKHGVSTLLELSDRWAPSEDRNNPDRHAANILQATNGQIASVTASIDLDDPETLHKVCYGIMVAENGRKAVDLYIGDDLIRLAIEMATG